MRRHPLRTTRLCKTLGHVGFALVALGAAWAGRVAPLLGQDPSAAKLEYNRDIRPILADTCFACHGPDSASRKADLRLDQRDAAIEAGAIVPGDPAGSELLNRVLSSDPEQAMPPPETKKKLSAKQIATLRRWLQEGAEYQPHWSFIAPTKPAPPTPRAAGWARNPIDQFVLAKLEAAGLTPAPEADRRALARRVSLDLTGLPPEPADVEAFVNDAANDAYEKFVDKLLKSPDWGEHRGRYWLDYARYADTHGIHFDNFREMWTYREWVVSAFNRDMPYDQFTIENLAGDLLPEASVEQRIGSGFNRCNITTNEGGVIAEEYLVHYTRDRTETTAQVWLGLSAGCAVCHSHKFDPLSQKEFYQLAAFFNNTTQGAMDGNIKDTPPIIQVPSMVDQQRAAELAVEIPEVKKQVEARKQAARGAYEQWLAQADPAKLAPALPTTDLYLHAALDEGPGQKTVKVVVDGAARDAVLGEKATWQAGATAAHALQPQGAAVEFADVGDFDKNQAFTCAAWLKFPANDAAGAICARMDEGAAFRGWDFWAQRRQVGTHVINTWPENAVKVVAATQVPANQWTHVAVVYDGSAKAAGVRIYYNGQPQNTAVEADKLGDTTRTSVPFKIGQRHNSSPLSGAALQDLRVYKRALSAAEVEVLGKSTKFANILAKPAEQRSDAEKNELYAWWLGTFDGEYPGLAARVAKLEAEQAAVKGRGTIAHVMQEKGSPAMAYVLFRGDYDKRRDPVTPATPEALPKFPDDYPKNRLGFARWLLLPEHPLTARVTVNRFWQEVFGQGLVRTSGDFGVAGELPSHPELLDWLAVDFRESGWNVKRLFKLMVTSATYRQAAAATPLKLEKDPQNRLLSRGPRFRMDAEMVRDHALAASGLMTRKIGGPSVKPYQPSGVWEAVAMIGSNTRDYRRDTGENLYRRSMYTFWKRAAPPASMEIFNATNREQCAVRRERTNTPLQALVTLNDEQFVEAAKYLAQRALKEGGADDHARLDFAANRLLARPFRAEERPVAAESLAELRAYYAAAPEDAAKLLAVGEFQVDPALDKKELAAWTMLMNQLMNLDEVLNK